MAFEVALDALAPLLEASTLAVIGRAAACFRAVVVASSQGLDELREQTLHEASLGVAPADGPHRAVEAPCYGCPAWRDPKKHPSEN